MKTITFRSCATIVVAFFLLVLAGCTRNSGTSNSNPLGSYFFNATFMGQTYNFNNQFIQRGDDAYGDLGGYVPNNNFSLAGGPFLSNLDTTTRSKILSKANTTFTFAPGNTIQPDVVIEATSLNFYHTMPTTDPSYNLKFTNIAFLRTDTVVGYSDDVYAVSGTFKAKMADPNTGAFAGDATGSFTVQCTCPHF
jgi:hypothetical protein